MDFILEPNMSSTINTKVGFSFDNGILKSIVIGMDGVTKSVFGAAESVVKLNKKLGNLSKIQGLSSLSTVITNSVGGVKSLIGHVGRLNDLLIGFANRGDKIAKTSRLVGMSVESYQQLGYAAGMSGISIEDLDSSLIKFNENIAKARSGDKTAAKMFKSLLPEKAKLADYKSSLDVLKAVSDGYKKIKISEDKVFASRELFGKSGVKMTELLSAGSAAIAKTMEESPEGFSEKGAKAAENFGDALSNVKLKLDGIVVTVMQDLFPVFTELFDEIRKYVKENETTLISQLKEVGYLVAQFVKDLLPRIPKILDFIVKLIDSIGPGWVAAFSAFITMLPALSQIVIGMASLKPIVFGVGSAIIVFLVKIKDIVWAVSSAFKIASTVVGGTFYATVGGVLILFVEIAAIVKQFYDNWDMWCSFVNHELTDAVNDWIDMFVEDVKWLWNGFKSIFIDPFLNFFKALPDAFSNLWDGFKNGVSQIGSFIYNTFFGAISGAINAAKGLLSSLPLVGGLFASDGAAPVGAAPSNVAAAVQQSYTTTTSRFAVDFNNVPRGATITPPAQGDFDWSRSYTLAGGV